MQAPKNIEDRIQDYLDGLCDEKEAAEVERNITADPVWENSFAEISQTHRLLQSHFEPLEPSMRFSKNVMEQISGTKIARPTRQYLHPLFIWLIGGTLATMLLFIFGYSVSLADFNTNPATPFKIPEVKLPSVNWGSYVNQGSTLIFLLLNTILGLALLDKWLRRKKGINATIVP